MTRGELIAVVLLVAPSTVSAQTYPTEYDKGKGIEVVSWCTSSGAKSSLREKLSKGSECRKAFLRHGDKSENNLGLSAIKEICLGNNDLAKDFVRACDCHNPGDLTAVWKEWWNIVDWAKAHPYCEQWANWGRQATKCRSSGKIWNDETRTCTDPAPQPSPLNAACICQYGNGQIAAWFTFRPHNYGQNGGVEVWASSCQNLTICEQFKSKNGSYYSFYTGRMTIAVDQWSEHTNLVTGSRSYSVWGRAQ